ADVAGERERPAAAVCSDGAGGAGVDVGSEVAAADGDARGRTGDRAALRFIIERRTGDALAGGEDDLALVELNGADIEADGAPEQHRERLVLGQRDPADGVV